MLGIHHLKHTVTNSYGLPAKQTPPNDFLTTNLDASLIHTTQKETFALITRKYAVLIGYSQPNKMDVLGKFGQEEKGWKGKAEVVRLTTVEVQVARSQEENDKVGCDEGSEDTQVPPAVAEFISERLEKFVPNLECAVLTHISCIVEEVTWSSAGEEIAHICSAVLARGSSELVEFHWCTLNSLLMEFGNDHTADKTGEGIELVQPSTPEAGDLRLGNRDTAEKCKDNDDERIDKRRNERSWCECSNHLA